ncbi:alanine-tRNA synthetase second additional domain-containing protein [Feifania hominis]|uniref:Alanine-tRNA synthetase second additional domain-containing protein n=1 Tax=Feifania hominis TaxID=2763660 RepID=A0A926HUV4_9FIRM|nr:alanine-tRNA synthetase second additional domain-containing protein [Feifania hominis]MBC8535956.1 alanine-tRNA synthetase second additional domain-containing protein [Feifania hominis]
MRLDQIQESMLYSVYFAPRGKLRMLGIGNSIAQRHLLATDRLIGFVGDSGAGKSMLIKGMFPGLELTNDDEGVNIRPLPLLSRDDAGFFNSHTYHMDCRFEMAFTQAHVLADAVRAALEDEKRVIVEHFDLLYPALGMNAELLIGVGEEIIVTRPGVFGPEPQGLAEIVMKSLPYRKMVHSAEDLTEHVMKNLFGVKQRYEHGDVRHGFLLEYDERPDVDLREVEREVKALIARDVAISFLDENHILIDNEIRHRCTGPRLHVTSAREILNFSLLPEFRYDAIKRKYYMVGLVGYEHPEMIHDFNQIGV